MIRSRPCLLIFAVQAAITQGMPAQGRFPWEGNQLGLERTVPAPWTPIEARGSLANVWGRTIDFGSGALPRQITSQGVPLLARPIEVSLVVNGRESRNHTSHAGFAEVAGDRLVAAELIECHGADLAIRTQLDFDGLLRIALKLSARGEDARLGRLTIEIPFPRRVAEYFSHYLYYDFDIQEIDRMQLIQSAGRIDRPVSRAFVPHFWVGNRHVGIELGMETDLFWSTQDPGKAIELIPQGDSVAMRLNVVNREVTIREPMVIEFGLIPMPVKPQFRDFRARVVANQRTVPDAWSRPLWDFNTMRVGPNFFIPLEYESLSIPPKEPRLRAEYDAVRTELRKNRIRYIPYSALHSIDVRIPEVEVYLSEWVRNPSPDRVRPAKGRREAISLHPRSVQDFYVWNFVNLIKTEDEEGLYFDWATTGKPVVNPLAARWHVTDPAKTYTPVFSVAEFHRRLYRAARSIRPDYLLTQHHSKMPALYSIYSDIIYSGEAMNPLFREVGRQMQKRGELPDGSPPYWPDYSLFPDDFWMAVYHQGFGTSHMFLPNISKIYNREWIAKHPDHYRRFTRCLLARTLVLDTPVVSGGLHLPTLNRLLLGFQNHFGGLRDPIRHIGPEEADLIRVRSDGTARLKVAAYVKPDGRTVLVCANWTGDPVRESVVLKFPALKIGRPGIVRVTDLEGGPAPHFTPHEITVELPPNDYAAWLIE